MGNIERKSMPRWVQDGILVVGNLTVASALLLMSLPLQADSSLYLKDVPQSNVLFLIDDALSLDFERIMDGEEEERLGFDDYRFYFKYKNLNSINDIAPHCTRYNKLAYDPSKTYRPWWGTDSEGKTFQDQTNIMSVPFDPYLPKDVGIADAGQIARNQDNHTDLSQAFYLVWTDGNENGEYDDGECPVPALLHSGCLEGENGDKLASNVCVTVSDMSSAEQINFANWYAYHRKREYIVKYALAEVINKSQARMGIGFSSTEKFHNIVSRGAEIKDVDDITLPIDAQAKINKEELLARVFAFDTKAVGKDISQIRRTYESAGNYFEREEIYDYRDSSGVRELFGYDSDEAEPESPIIISDARGMCQSNATVVIAGRYENGSDSSNYSRRILRQHVDGDNNTDYDGEWINGVSPKDSYADNRTDTLADAAMFFYERDLYPDIDNPNIIQRMSTHMVALGLEGTLSEGPSTAAEAFTWPDRVNSHKETVDDMRHAAWNGRGKFHDPEDGDELVTALKDILFNVELAAENEANAVGSNMLSVTSLRASSATTAFVTRFEPSIWTGQLLAYPINPVTLELESQAWNAADLIPTHANRNIFSHNGDSSFEFTVAALTSMNGFSDAQKANLNMLNGEIDNLAEKRVNYLRGDQTDEGTAFRSRSGLLGDIVNSDAFYTYDENHRYHGLETVPNDTSDSNTSYYHYLRDSKRARRPMVYLGANDGMLHGFYATADSNLSSDVAITTCKDTDAKCAGEEAFAYIPKSVYGNLSNLGNPDYVHNYFVDGPAIVADAYINFSDVTSNQKRWGSVLLGSLGIGGAGVFALDVSEPDSFSSDDVLWDLDATDLPNLGSLSGRISVVKLPDDSWAAVFGNGYGSANHKAGLYIVPLEHPEDAIFIDTLADGTADNPNGLSAALATDTDGDNKADRIYAGDLQGNMWVFDLSETTSSSWDVAYGTSASPKPLFRACTTDDCSSPQPITMRPEVVKNNGGQLVLFGTGSYRTADDVGSTQVQSFYGVQDDEEFTVTNRSSLQKQEIVHEYTVQTTGEHRITSKNSVDYNSSKGWYIDFNSSRFVGERMITDPVVRRDTVRFFTFTVEGGVCSRNGGDSWFMELDFITGARASSSTFDVNGDGVVDENDLGEWNTGAGIELVPASGFKAEGLVKTPDFASNGENTRLRGDSSSGGLVERARKKGPPLGRQSWSQLR